MRMRNLSAVVLAFGVTRSFALAAPTETLVPNSPPSTQSDCEFRANLYKAQHPGIDSGQFLKSGFFWFGDAEPPNPSQSYRDAETGVTFYVESDGRHVAAIDSAGKIIWVRNPFVDRNLCPYRSAHPYIYWIGPPGGSFGRNFIGPFTPVPDDKANALILNTLTHNYMPKVTLPEVSDRFIGIAFNSSQSGYIDIRNGDFYMMGQN